MSWRTSAITVSMPLLLDCSAFGEALLAISSCVLLVVNLQEMNPDTTVCKLYSAGISIFGPLLLFKITLVNMGQYQ